MVSALTVDDLWPLVQTLSSEEQLEWARRALRAAALADADAYRARPPSATEFHAHEDGLDWEAEGWESFDAAR